MDNLPLELVYNIKSYLDISAFYNSQLICHNFTIYKVYVKEKCRLLEQNKSFMYIMNYRTTYPLIIKTNFFHGFQNGPMYGFGQDRKYKKYIYLLRPDNSIIDKKTCRYISIIRRLATYFTPNNAVLYEDHDDLFSEFYDKNDNDFLVYHKNFIIRLTPCSDHYLLDAYIKNLYDIYELSDDEYNNINIHNFIFTHNNVRNVIRNKKAQCVLSGDNLFYGLIYFYHWDMYNM